MFSNLFQRPLIVVPDVPITFLFIRTVALLSDHFWRSVLADKTHVYKPLDRKCNATN